MNRQLLIDSYAAMFKMGYTISTTELGLVYNQGKQQYEFKDGGKTLNVVETVLLGYEYPTGDWIQDAASALGTTPDFIRGFVAGLAFWIGPKDKPS